MKNNFIDLRDIPDAAWSNFTKTLNDHYDDKGRGCAVSKAYSLESQLMFPGQNKCILLPLFFTILVHFHCCGFACVLLLGGQYLVI